LDSLDSEKFKQLTGGKLEKVIDGLMAAKQAGFKPIKINMVLMKDINDNEVEDMVDFCIEHGFTLRFIETMPVGDMGRKATDNYIDLQQIKTRLAEKFDLIPGVMPGGGPARYLKVANTDINIGFITPMSQHFCATCNRVRLSVDGTIYTCLGQENHFELRPLLRAGISDEELEQAIRTAINLKPEKHDFNENPNKVLRFMSYTGG
ncbi:MAG: GTP 3',8-cyclase MoaA, partial [Gammaproteobacteria bacterium]|nr:GTP 3',8-cyclase MoaA [Gammaproteobacteria bacterium]